MATGRRRSDMDDRNDVIAALCLTEASVQRLREAIVDVGPGVYFDRDERAALIGALGRSERERDEWRAIAHALADAIDCDCCPLRPKVVGGEECDGCQDRLIAWARGVVDEIGGR
jgi:hypothetical protein